MFPQHSSSVLFLLSLSKIKLSSQWRQSVTMQLHLMTFFPPPSLEISWTLNCWKPWTQIALGKLHNHWHYSWCSIPNTKSELCPSFCLLMKLPETPNASTKSTSHPLYSETKSGVIVISFLNVCLKFSASKFSNEGS